MYIPHYFNDSTTEEVKEFIDKYIFGILFNQTKGKYWASHIPMEMETNEEGKDILIGHISKGNRQWKGFKEKDDVLAVFQGERELVTDNRKLGEFILKGIPPMSAGIPKIEIQFMIDADGILRVKAMENRSKAETEVEIKSQYGISEEEMALMLKDSIVYAQDNMSQLGLIEARTEAQNIILSSDKFITQN